MVLNSIDSRWLLLRNLIRFSANDDSAMGDATAKELRFMLDSNSAVSMAEG